MKEKEIKKRFEDPFMSPYQMYLLNLIIDPVHREKMRKDFIEINSNSDYEVSDKLTDELHDHLTLENDRKSHRLSLIFLKNLYEGHYKNNQTNGGDRIRSNKQ